MTTQISNSHVASIVASYQLPDEIPFGVEMAPVMFRAEFSDGQWQPGSLVPFGDVPVNPASTALQFAQQAFEGMKAYKGSGSEPTLFRPDMNWRRFARSADRLRMPVVPAELFAEGLSELVVSLSEFVPEGRGQSLYLRPTLFGLDPHFALKSSDRFLFLILASPSDAYYADAIRIMIERENCRAARGGTGAEKVGGNYAASLMPNANCVQRGFDQSLWLDPTSSANIEELSAMNFMAIVDGALHTPELSGSLLEGVTRDSLLKLAPQLGVESTSRVMPVNQVLSDIESGRCSELFACGTGAIVAPIAAIGESDGREWPLRDVGVMSAKLRDALLDVQEGETDDPFGWVVDATDARAVAAFIDR
ncbi:MAG: branched-chain amino acid aminotransferase [Woeseiaceae bacterium]